MAIFVSGHNENKTGIFVLMLTFGELVLRE